MGREQAAPVAVMSAMVVMPLEIASSPPSTAESYQSFTSILVLFSATARTQVV